MVRSEILIVFVVLTLLIGPGVAAGCHLVQKNNVYVDSGCIIKVSDVYDWAEDYLFGRCDIGFSAGQFYSKDQF